ncbi:MAG: AraC family transcriptional regulator [Desulfobacterales bacterium]|nr:AraC family transcriptional regulator [Desulfobacterales bacterium]
MKPSGTTPYVINDTDLFETSATGFARKGTVRVREAFGTGSIRIRPVREGISFSVNEICYNRDITIRTTEETLDGQICFYAYLSGSACFTFRNRAFKIEAGGSDIFTGGWDKSIKQTLAGDSPITVVGVFFDHDSFHRISGRTPEEIHRYSSGISHRRQRQMSAAMAKVAVQLSGGGCGKADEKLFIEAKVLELVAHKLGQVDGLAKKRGGDNKSCTERIHYAAELLAEQMTVPPGIFDLADAAGLNHNRLIRGFKEVFGCTPYAYLKKIRLERAEYLISRCGMNVTDAAFQVGYANLSHFARNFRQRFKVNPSGIRK